MIACALLIKLKSYGWAPWQFPTHPQGFRCSSGEELQDWQCRLGADHLNGIWSGCMIRWDDCLHKRKYLPMEIVLVFPRFMRRRRPAPNPVFPEADGLLTNVDVPGGDEGSLPCASGAAVMSALLPCFPGSPSESAPVLVGGVRGGDVRPAGPGAELAGAAVMRDSALRRSASFASWATICTYQGLSLPCQRGRQQREYDCQLPVWSDTHAGRKLMQNSPARRPSQNTAMKLAQSLCVGRCQKHKGHCTWQTAMMLGANMRPQLTLSRCQHVHGNVKIGLQRALDENQAAFKKKHTCSAKTRCREGTLCSPAVTSSDISCSGANGLPAQSERNHRRMSLQVHVQRVQNIRSAKC